METGSWQVTLQSDWGVVLRIDSSDGEIEQKHKLLEMVEVSGLLDTEQEESLWNFLAEHHEALCIDPGE